ncbi:MAG: hypothetical protein ACE5GE_15740, partial [Phycisphaerae bacterium]
MMLRCALAASFWAAFVAVGPVRAAPRDVQIRSINIATGVIELHNFGPVDQLLGGWQFCTQDDNQLRVYSASTALNPFTVEAGTSFFVHLNNDAPGGADSVNGSALLFFAGPLDAGPFAISLYFPPVVFPNGNTMADHVQWTVNGA